MINTDATDFRKKIFSLLEQTIKYNEPVNISTKDGNAILMSESDYNDIMATLEIYNNPRLHKKITDRLNIPVADCVNEDEVVW